MGTEQSAVREGFVQVTAKSVYSKEGGYGWRSSEGLEEFVQASDGIFTNITVEESLPIYTNEITEDMIYSKLPNLHR
jgi:hypothetical protein